MSAADFEAPLDDVGLVPFGRGTERGLDARTLGTRGTQLEVLAGFSLPVPAGITVPVPNVPGLVGGQRAQAALDIVEMLAGAAVGSVDASRGLMLLRVSASAPLDAAGLPPELTGLGLDITNLPDGFGAQIDADLYHVWWQTASFIAEHSLEVPADLISGLTLDHPDARHRVEPLLELCRTHGAAPWPTDHAEQLTRAAAALVNAAMPAAARH